MATIRRLAGRPVAPPLGYDLSCLGYIEEEFLLSGEARSYELDGERVADGRWDARPSDVAGFTTRLLVRRPIDARDGSGVFVVEWLNVSGGVDAAPVWTVSHRHLARRRHAWIGVSAQKAGIDGGGLVEGSHLKKADVERYGILSHPGDSWSFDIMSQAGHVARSEWGARVLLAAGESQSAMYLFSYANALDQVEPVFDGFFLHGCGCCGAPFDGSRIPLGRAANAAGERVRADVRVPVLLLQSETDVVTFPRARTGRIDGRNLVEWEIAGAAHGDTYLLRAGHYDDGQLTPLRFADLLAPTADLAGDTQAPPINSGPQQHYVAQAAVDWLERWASGGSPAPSVPRLDRVPDGEGFMLNTDGMATGGLRTPWVDVPTAALSGLRQPGGGRAMLFGNTTTYPAADLTQRYPGGVNEYRKQFAAALDEAIDRSVLLPEDREEILAVAEAAFLRDSA